MGWLARDGEMEKLERGWQRQTCAGTVKMRTRDERATRVKVARCPMSIVVPLGWPLLLFGPLAVELPEEATCRLQDLDCSKSMGGALFVVVGAFAGHFQLSRGAHRLLRARGRDAM